MLYARTLDRMADRARSASHLLLHRYDWLAAIFLPNEHDRAVVLLPRALRPLYFVVRPLRLATERARRLVQR